MVAASIFLTIIVFSSMKYLFPINGHSKLTASSGSLKSAIMEKHALHKLIPIVSQLTNQIK